MADWDRPGYYRFFAEEAANGGSPLYETLSRGIAGDPWLQSLAAHRHESQPPANMLFAAVHYLLLEGRKHLLQTYYPSLGGVRKADEEAFPQFRRFCDLYEEDLKKLIAEGRTNTNEVGRCTFLAPAFCGIAARTGKPLALIEIGPSAGLNLNFDQYAYRYLDEHGHLLSENWYPGGLTLSCELKSDTVPALPPSPPEIASRIGLELSPVDLSSDHDRRWLKALVWPERRDRFAKLSQALEVADRHPPKVRGGDALDLLPEALADALAEAAICVYHSMVTYQFSREMKNRLEEILSGFARTRPLWRISVEGSSGGNYPLRVTRYDPKGKTEETLASCNPHGLWLDWYSSQ